MNKFSLTWWKNYFS